MAMPVIPLACRRTRSRRLLHWSPTKRCLDGVAGGTTLGSSSCVLHAAGGRDCQRKSVISGCSNARR